jgi:uncharacterized protein YndB with AHSA1/START domain
MKSIREKLIVRADPAKVFEAITTEAGYTGWWSKDCQIARKPGEESRLKFNKEGTVVSMRFRLDEIAADRSVRWTCTGHDMESWVGTQLRWQVGADPSGTEVTFEHDEWKGDAPEPVVQGWRHFLGSLRSWVETGQGQPW